jgi:hypothetical protein
MPSIKMEVPLAKKLHRDLMHGPGRPDPTPNGSLAPARQNTSADPRGPPAFDLSDEDVARILADYFLPSDRLLQFNDLIKAGLVTNYNHLARAVACGFPPGAFFTAKRRVWTPRAIALHLNSLPHEPPAVLTELRRRGGRRRAEIAASRA